MPNGEANVTGNVFEILHADRHSAGHYRCSADNRVGAADTREIFVNVLCKKRFYQLAKCVFHLNISFPSNSFAWNRSRASFHSHRRWLWGAINVSRSFRTTSKHCLVQRYDPIRNHGTTFSTGKKQIFGGSFVFSLSFHFSDSSWTCKHQSHSFISSFIHSNNSYSAIRSLSWNVSKQSKTKTSKIYIFYYSKLSLLVYLELSLISIGVISCITQSDYFSLKFLWT